MTHVGPRPRRVDTRIIIQIQITPAQIDSATPIPKETLLTPVSLGGAEIKNKNKT